MARCYQGLADLFVLDRTDAAWAARIEALGMRVLVTDTFMHSPAHAARLATAVLRGLPA